MMMIARRHAASILSLLAGTLVAAVGAYSRSFDAS